MAGAFLEFWNVAYALNLAHEPVMPIDVHQLN